MYEYEGEWVLWPVPFIIGRGSQNAVYFPEFWFQSRLHGAIFGHLWPFFCCRWLNFGTLTLLTLLATSCQFWQLWVLLVDFWNFFGLRLLVFDHFWQLLATFFHCFGPIFGHSSSWIPLHLHPLHHPHPLQYPHPCTRSSSRIHSIHSIPTSTNMLHLISISHFWWPLHLYKQLTKKKMAESSEMWLEMTQNNKKWLKCQKWAKIGRKRPITSKKSYKTDALNGWKHTKKEHGKPCSMSHVSKQEKMANNGRKWAKANLSMIKNGWKE